MTTPVRFGPFAEIEAELEPEERERSLGAHRDAEHLAGVGMQAAGNVEREHVRAAVVDRANRACDRWIRPGATGRCRRSRRRSTSASARQSHSPGDRPSARRDEVVVRAARVTLQAWRARARRSLRRPCAVAREARQHVAIAAVVARPADDERCAAPTASSCAVPERRFAGTRHQRVGRNLQIARSRDDPARAPGRRCERRAATCSWPKPIKCRALVYSAGIRASRMSTPPLPTIRCRAGALDPRVGSRARLSADRHRRASTFARTKSG